MYNFRIAPTKSAKNIYWANTMTLTTGYVSANVEELIGVTSPKAGVSDKYQFAPTSEIIETLQGAGFTLVKAQYAGVRNRENAGRQKHLLTFEHPDQVSTYRRDEDGEKLQLKVFNSHDRSCSLKFMVGVFRFICSNGMIDGDISAQHSLIHRGSSSDIFNGKKDEILAALPGYFEVTKNNIARFKRYKYTDTERETLAGIVAEEMLKNTNAQKVNLESVWTPRQARPEENMWQLLNNIQESAFRGGIQYYSETENRKGWRNTRPIRNSSVQRIVGLNQLIWTTAQDLITV